MIGRLTALGTALIAGAVLAIGWLGWLQPADNALRDFRASLDSRAPTGETIFIDIDARTLGTIGVWPWPRRIHGEILDRLMDLGAAEVVFDIDFSTASNPEDDAIFEAALERAGGYALLAAFRQEAEGGSDRYNLPAERFRRHAPPVVVNVGIDQGGIVRSYPYAAAFEGVVYPSLAAALSGTVGAPGQSFFVDYSIEPSGVVRIPAADLLAGDVDPALVDGRQVVVGASALELRDIFIVPAAGTLPGAMVQIIATETLKQGRALLPLGPGIGTVLALMLAAISMVVQQRAPLKAIIGASLLFAILLEAAAFLLQSRAAVLLDTAVVHAVLFGLVLRTVGLEIGVARLLHLKASHERDATRSILDRVIADNLDGIVVIEESGRIVAASELAEDVLGAGLVGKSARAILPARIDRDVAAVMAAGTVAARAAPAELLLPGPDQEVRIIEYSITLSEVTAINRRNPRTQRVACLTFRDITERRQKDERLTYLVSHDAMTGAWSRHKLIELIDELMADDRTRARGITVVIFDLGRFKAINDTLGHGFGDMVLKQVTGRLKACDVEAVARLGGDSFAVVRCGIMSEEELAAFCGATLERITDTYILEDGHQAIVAASAGATTSAASGYDPQVLLSHADMALSVAKKVPGNTHAVFVPEMDERLKSKQDMETALRQAIQRGQLSLSYQPQVELETGRLVGVEALVRWNHPQLGAVSPAQFIPAAEETGQIVELGRYVLQTACREAASWPGAITLAVNVSPIQFELVDVVAEIAEALRLSGLPAQRLDIEITEGLFMSRAAVVTDTLQRLRGMGIGIALDDFGTGYSSLSYLGRLPVDKIKIDQSFVRGLPGDQEAGAIVRAVMTLSETLGKVVIAEGIETADQAWMLHLLGCRIGQGYHYGRPKTPDEMVELLSGETGWQAARAG